MGRPLARRRCPKPAPQSYLPRCSGTMMAQRIRRGALTRAGSTRTERTPTRTSRLRRVHPRRSRTSSATRPHSPHRKLDPASAEPQFRMPGWLELLQSCGASMRLKAQLGRLTSSLPLMRVVKRRTRPGSSRPLLPSIRSRLDGALARKRTPTCTGLRCAFAGA